MDGLKIIQKETQKEVAPVIAQLTAASVKIADLENRVAHLEAGVPAAGTGAATTQPIVTK